jgi:hypothetical protein
MLFLVREGMVEGRCIKDSATARTLIGFVDFSCGGNELQRARATEKVANVAERGCGWRV